MAKAENPPGILEKLKPGHKTKFATIFDTWEEDAFHIVTTYKHGKQVVDIEFNIQAVHRHVSMGDRTYAVAYEGTWARERACRVVAEVDGKSIWSDKSPSGYESNVEGLKKSAVLAHVKDVVKKFSEWRTSRSC